MYRLKTAVRQAAKSIGKSLPVLLGVIGLVGIANSLVPKTGYDALFGGNWLIDSFTGAFMGSVLTGNPITSYVLGGEMLEQGVSLVAVTSFIVAWVTVGVVQFPGEAMLLGRRFALVRMMVCFVFAILVGIITVGALQIL